jgi:hypothetical protein
MLQYLKLLKGNIFKYLGKNNNMKITRKHLKRIIKEELSKTLNEQEQSHSDFLERYVNNMLEKGFTRVDTMPVGPGPDMLAPGPVQYRISGYGTSAWTNPGDGAPEDAGWYVVSTGGIRGSATEDRIAVLDSPESPMTKVGDDWFHGKIYAILKK